MPIRPDRIAADIEAIAAFTESPIDIGHSRPTFSPAWRSARDHIIAEATVIGCHSRIDAGGNVHIRPSHLSWDSPVWLSGSHIDSVPTGGKFDGVVGIVVPLECLRAAAEQKTPIAMELIIFAEEEGTTFGLGMIGSRLWTGAIQAEHIVPFKNKAGQTYFEAGRSDGVDLIRLKTDRFEPSAYFGFLEVHVEQGPAMWAENIPLTVVTAIAGRMQFKVTLRGQANHAGSTPMSYRRDALVAAAAVIAGVQQIANDLGGGTVATVGRLDCEPNAINVIPGTVRLTIDLRSGDSATLAAGRELIEKLVAQAGVVFEIAVTEDQPVVSLDDGIVSGLAKAGVTNRAVSGALHDAAILAPLLPTAMLFIASEGGISHNPKEFSRIEDIAAAAAVLLRFLGAPASQIVSIRELNEFGRTAFDAVCGSLFEHSPWVAQHTWPSRPFENVSALHAALCQTMYAAAQDQQLSLIRAHPDLVGKLARQGQLTRESNGEQASAGLDRLTTDEARQFDEYNAAYREKFDFPFIICARENKKEAILAAFPGRLNNSRVQEIHTALAEIAKIARLRLLDRVTD